MKHIIILMTLSLICSSFGPIDQNNTEEHSTSTLILKMNYKSPGLRGSGGSLTIRNLETREIFKSKSEIGFNSFIIVEDLPIGNYEVLALEIISGGPTMFIRDKSLFNILELESPKNYYLGNYLSNKIKPIFKMNIAVTKKENDSENQINKQLLKKSEKWLDLEIDYNKSLFKEDRTEINTRN